MTGDVRVAIQVQAQHPRYKTGTQVIIGQQVKVTVQSFGQVLHIRLRRRQSGIQVRNNPLAMRIESSAGFGRCDPACRTQE
ncbi:hypothetical protein D3C81_2011110 [compost metagenome]